MRKVMELGRKVPLDPAFNDPGHKLNVMFQITLSKFQQDPQLATRLLLDTGNKPIWHYCDDIFWGTSRPTFGDGAAPTHPSTHGRTLSERSATARPWWSGDNWNGRIFSVVRALLRKHNSHNLRTLRELVEREYREHCPCPEEYFELPEGALQPHDQNLVTGTVIAGRFK
jgi:predicted NAD-dependent protein-ADP-ribosyltransferase YbiA (DUF1768 family)